MKHRTRPAGFTLIELMVVVAIIGILTAVALPAYRSYVQKAQRADARTQLLAGAQFMQRFYAANDSFSTDRGGNGVATSYPTNLIFAPAQGTALYQVNTSITNYSTTPVITASATSFTLTMAPISGRAQATDTCGMFTLTSTGVRGVTGTASRDDCWK